MTDTIKLTRDQVVALGPCSEDRIPNFGRRKSMSAAQALEAGATIDDLLWVYGQLGRKDLCVKFALACAQRVAHLNPDPRVPAAIDAAAAWVADPSEENRAAARAAGDAAWAAWAAAGAAGDAAAGAAAWAAAGAAARAAWAAARAARAAEREAQRAIFLEIFG